MNATKYILQRGIINVSTQIKLVAPNLSSWIQCIESSFINVVYPCALFVISGLVLKRFKRGIFHVFLLLGIICAGIAVMLLKSKIDGFGEVWSWVAQDYVQSFTGVTLLGVFLERFKIGITRKMFASGLFCASITIFMVD